MQIRRRIYVKSNVGGCNVFSKQQIEHILSSTQPHRSRSTSRCIATHNSYLWHSVVYINDTMVRMLLILVRCAQRFHFDMAALSHQGLINCDRGRRTYGNAISCRYSYWRYRCAWYTQPIGEWIDSRHYTVWCFGIHHQKQARGRELWS